MLGMRREAESKPRTYILPKGLAFDKNLKEIVNIPNQKKERLGVVRRVTHPESQQMTFFSHNLPMSLKQ